MIVFIDESGFYLTPFIVRTYAPKGETPHMRCQLSYQHLSSISAVTPDGRIYKQIQNKSYKSNDVIGFLKHLLRYIKGKILIIWDGCPIHRSKAVQKFIKDECKGRIHMERLPAYSPELNPDEGVWQYLKCVLLKNVCCTDIGDLWKKLKASFNTLKQRKNIVRGFFRRCGLCLN